MAVTRESYNPTEHLILAKPRRQYRTGVRWHHWQLRSLVGSNGQNAVYFPVAASDRLVHVQQLNTTTGEAETVKRLSFTPRCLAAHSGWVCCGGEKGAFSAFQVGERHTETEVDARMNLLDERWGLAGSEPDEATLIAAIARARTDKNLLAQNKTFGKDRVNCITIWLPPTLKAGHEGSYTEPVAVLANNDCTVMVVSLPDLELLDEIKYPDFMNRAVISPDGRLLVAISDDPYLYVHKMKAKRTTSPRTEPTYEWSRCRKIQLESQSLNDRSDNRGSFAACFSSSGRYLAVGTQYGTISVFSVATLDVPDANPLLTFFSTSRPNQDYGAVRDMAFSPGPTDLLAWTEDRGRVGVADIRTGFDSRQILYIDKDSDYEQVSVTDRSTIDPRLLEPLGDSTSGEPLSSTLTNNLDQGPEPRPPPIQRPRPDVRDALERYNIPLTAEETAVLEAIQDHRRRQDQWTSELMRRARTGALGGDNSGSATGGGGSDRPGASGGATTTRSPWIERVTRVSNAARPRNHSPSMNRPTEDRLADARIPTASVSDRVRQAGQTIIREDELRASAAAVPRRPGALDSIMSNAPPPERRRAAFLLREWEESPTRRMFGTYMAARPEPYDTAGLTWSENGEVLYVGAENAIYEFHVNRFARKLSPSISLS